MQFNGVNNFEAFSTFVRSEFDEFVANIIDYRWPRTISDADSDSDLSFFWRDIQNFLKMLFEHYRENERYLREFRGSLGAQVFAM